MKRALVFSGQGSQYVGMARDLTHDHAAAREIVAKADAILGYGLSSIMFDGRVTHSRHSSCTKRQFLP
jgi:[acyl-carrier-protein] S-malonyltransferase